MKKVFLLICMVLTVSVTMAQTKKVAILEVEDTSGQLTDAQKLMLRSNLSRAVTNTRGYEAYSRSDMDAIMNEHLFQRSGNVDSEQIRELGRMTGVSLILITKAVRSGNQMFVDATILNVETAQQELQDNMIMGLDAESMQQGCAKLAQRLFGVTATSSAMEKYNIERMGINSYTYMGKYLDKKEYAQFLRNNCPQAYKQYKEGRIWALSGWGMMGAGVVLTGAGLGMLIGEMDAGFAMLMTGAALTGVSVLVPIAVGYDKINKSHKTYNNTCASSAAPITLNFSAGSNGLGLALQF